MELLYSTSFFKGNPTTFTIRRGIAAHASFYVISFVGLGTINHHEPMWIWIIIGAIVIGGIVGAIASDGDAKDGAVGGGLAGGCLAANCLGRLAFAALAILFILWLFGVVFG